MNDDVDAVARSRKRKALLAGGTVLGLGAAVTLAAWTDDVWVSGAFSAGTFNVQGAVDADGEVWADYVSEGDAGPLTFSVSPTAMTPGDSVYAPLNLRIGPTASEYNADITLPTAPSGPADSSDTNNAFFNSLELSLYNLPPSDCNASDADAATALPGFADASLSTTSTDTLLTLDGDMTAQGVCFKVTLSDSATSDVSGGETGPLIWNFHAESAES